MLEKIIIAVFLIFTVDTLAMLFMDKVENPLKIAEYTIQISTDRVYEKAYNRCQDIIKHCCIEDPFLCGECCT